MIIHIGYHKTGTTFLQRSVFPNIKGITYYDYAFSKKLFTGLAKKPTLEFNSDQFKTDLDNNNSLYSFEALVGEMGIGTYNFEIANRLKEVGFKKVIISIRNQLSMLESLYRQYIQVGGVVKPKFYFDETNGLFRFNYCDYYKLIEYYKELFCKENVHIIIQEELIEKKQETLKKLLDFIGYNLEIEENSIKRNRSNYSLSRLSIKLLRVINHFTYNYYRPSNLLSKRISTHNIRFLLQKYLDPYLIANLSGKKPFLPKQVADKAISYYAKNNSRLEKEYNLDLKQYRYPME